MTIIFIALLVFLAFNTNIYRIEWLNGHSETILVEFFKPLKHMAVKTPNTPYQTRTTIKLISVRTLVVEDEKPFVLKIGAKSWKVE